MITIHYGEFACEHFKKEIAKARYHVANKDIDIKALTGSEHYLLAICEAVRHGKLRTDEVEIYSADGDRIHIDTKGQWIEPWPDELFESSFYLRFSEIDDTH